MDFGAVLFTSDRGITPADAAAAAEKGGFATFYVPEHSHIPTRRGAAHPATGDARLPDDRYMRTLDPWVSLATACAVTTEIRLSTAVCLPVQHDCITLAKSIATVDHLSGGRVEVCAGFGWNLDELADHNVPAGRRRTMLREYIEARRELWVREEASYSGEFVSYGPSWAWPKPVQAHLPILIGAAGNQKNLKWIAKNADGWMSTPQDADIEISVNLLHAEWDSAGRSGRPRIVVLDTHGPDASRLSHWADLGVSEVVYGLPDESTSEVQAYVGRLSDKLDAFATLDPASAAH
ncbi:LLM class F420-dependent oxidoreductase [Mycobacterium saskatchewanense]|uniref:LLM class F420-dependent oxidoreductase n=1 Tax=Mycobacterium saskatchewanense TaxID=220927 RepID=A0AAJ3TVR5_9MYCO|nr:LLM class F420-dependent oxidoreductase [Mycobacterium saskatchewanense]ORW72645.1 LLM class F420-dependent oxidoreductase [Mycobacterium saskatchewanense]BBX66004.1 LLM class F420-dependent oxidoreductase [Mycobacterium saskatchewanense]